MGGGGGSGGGESTSSACAVGVAYTAPLVVPFCGFGGRPPDGSTVEQCAPVAGRHWMLRCRNNCISESFFAEPTGTG